MRNRILIFLCLFLCLALAAGCSIPPAFPPESSAHQPQGPGGEEAPSPAPEEPGPAAAPKETDAGRSFPFAALDGDTLYWCTSYGVLSGSAGGGVKLFSQTRGRNPLAMDGYLYVVEDEMDITGEDVIWPVPTEAATGSRILRIPLGGGEASEIYSAPYISSILACDSRLYLSTTQGESLQDAGGLFSIDAQGGDEKLLAEDCSVLFAAQGGYAYYLGVVEEASAFFRIPLEGGEGEQLLGEGGTPVTPLAYQGAVYYVYVNWSSAEAENNLSILRLRDGESEVVAGGIKAHELLGIWDGKLYYAAAPEKDASPLALARLDLAALTSETLQNELTQLAALSGACAAYSDSEPLSVATELKLLPLSGGEPAVLAIADAVESQG